QVGNAGSYVVILVSTAEQQGTLYGYGPNAPKSRRTESPDPLPPPRPGPDPSPKINVGDTRSFVVDNGSRLVTIQAAATAVTSHFVLWEDLTTPNEIGSVDRALVDQVLADLASVVVPREEQLFGAVSDVDADGRIGVVLSYTVNQYGARAYVNWCDIIDDAGCGLAGNGGEFVYLAIPDPADHASSVNGIVETVAHELSHLIYAYHKLALAGAAGGENIYVTEGMSALAQDLTGYNNGNQYVWAAAIATYDQTQQQSTQQLSINDLLRGTSYYSRERDGALRGGSYLLLRYLFEQQGGMAISARGVYSDLGGIDWLHRWHDSPDQGVAAVERTTGRDIRDVALDWYTAIVVSGRGLNDDPAFNFRARTMDPITGYYFGVDTFATIHGWLHLQGPPIVDYDLCDGEIRAGGVEYLRLVTDPGEIWIPVDPQALPRARLFRIE
ncbi:MAG: hypothetical protein JXR83_21170, partial [Deltaproteobacteria bacterium]|nr:hypothetical protein [Deltaproteobacteria bacterium]